jgi:hypothetical protein
MNKIYLLGLPLLVSHLSFVGFAQALPGMESDEVIAWFKTNRSIGPFLPTEKYETDVSGFYSPIQVNDGNLSLSIFLDVQGNVETEHIDYRPKCYPSPECRGTTLFEKADRSSGKNLIKTVWGQEVLDDFKTSTFMETLSINGTNRWYQGKLYNYETWHYTNNTIIHFSVVSKRSDQGTRIRKYTYCAKNPRACGP